MKRQRGFTLLEIMLVILLLGISGSVVLMTFPADNGALARQGKTLQWMLNDTLDRAERDEGTYNVTFSSRGWQIVREGNLPSQTSESRLPDDIELSLRVEGQEVPLESTFASAPQVWLYPGGETSLFDVTLKSQHCVWQLNAPGFFLFEASEIQCDETEK